MGRTIDLIGIRAPNAAITVENILKNSDDRSGALAFVISPGAEQGIEAVAKKYGYTYGTEPAGKLLAVRLTPGGIKMEEIDVTGDTCPGPVITVGNYLSNMAVGDRVRVKSNLADTLEDITMAVKSTGSRVVETGKEDDRHFLVVEKGIKAAAQPGAIVNKDRVLVVQSNGIGNAERAYATFIFSKVALSMGKKVTIFTLMDGASIARKGNAASVKHPDFDRLDRLMDEVLKAGATMYVCELSAKFRGIKPTDLVDGAKMAGAATFIELLSDPSYAIVNF